MKKKDSYFDSVGGNGVRVFSEWNNGKFGTITVDDFYNIKFQELDESSYNQCEDFIYMPIGESRIIGGGIIGYWLAMRKGIFQNSQIFRSYLDWEIENHVRIHGQDPDSWKRDLRAEGIDACETFEQAWECAFESFKEYFSESDVSYLTELKKQFLDYLNYCRKHPELPKTLDEARAVIASKDKEIARLREEIARLKNENEELNKKLETSVSDDVLEEQSCSLMCDTKMIIDTLDILFKQKKSIRDYSPQNALASIFSKFTGLKPKTFVNEFGASHTFTVKRQVEQAKEINSYFAQLGIKEMLKTEKS